MGKLNIKFINNNANDNFAKLLSTLVARELVERVNAIKDAPASEVKDDILTEPVAVRMV